VLWNRQVSHVMSVGAQSKREIPDEELVRRFQSSGDAECFAELFVRHRKRIYFACRGFFSDGSAAEDATQVTFLRAYQKIGHFREGNFCGWLIRIAKNVCIDQWRKRRPEIATEDIEPDALPDAETLDRMSDLHLAVEKLRREMESLSLEQRRCLELKIEGYSYDETAMRTGLSVEAVKSHIQNGRRALWLKMEGTLSRVK
jgi:RNA polymerase sigma-70 factor (ECF subfamily)